ncbi:glycosyltransferase family 4 protein [Fictibacillus fluitans]|uniref:Glycosyltransferase family 1 protein n=1 Tax=Fictibacillus fluitans TaxID=3058422 RepID=A0ABT8HS96_9BACL|nr:glycosyltransferase family 1 protein [Fictibacillus sp. NE201]MDN4523628.1 glycosyltransferase family 1 protein [Fictibacillus sp. NE201]
MNIAFDTFYSFSDSNMRGIGTYSKSLIQQIMELNSKHTLFFFSPIPGSKSELEKDRLKKFLERNSIDIYHITSPIEYFFNYNELLDEDLFLNVKVAVTFYDVIPWIYKDIYLRNEKEKQHFIKMMNFINNCDLIFAISNKTKEDGIKHFNMNHEKVEVIHGGVDPLFKKTVDPTVLTNLGITNPYLLFIGGMEFRKNLLGFIHAFGKISTHLPERYDIVLPGRFTETYLSQIKRIASLYHIDERLIFPGYLSLDHLVKVYSQAVLFVFPSLYEGLGLPVIEAMACGTPVLTSKTSSMDEIGGDSCYKINPSDIGDLANGMQTILTKPELQKSFIEKGIIHAKSFTWPKTALKVLNAYEKIIK